MVQVTKPAPGRGGGGFLGTSLLGVLASAALLWFVIGTGGNAVFFYNEEGLVIVVGGVTCVALLAFRGDEILHALGSLAGVFREKLSIDADIAELIEVARLLHEKKIKQADERVRTVRNTFVRLGLQLVVDGTQLDDLMHVLTWRIQKQTEADAGQSRVFRVLASFAPAFGLLGTLAGMVGMLKQLGSGDIGLIGNSMAVAMLATLYGLILANLVFKPIAIKLEQRSARRVAMMNVLMDGVVLTHLGRSPLVIQDLLNSYLHEGDTGGGRDGGRDGGRGA